MPLQKLVTAVIFIYVFTVEEDRTVPNVIIIAGANGAGKSTAAPVLLQHAVHLNNFVNADVIAQGLCAFEPEKVAMQAGRFMLKRLHQLAEERATFAFETTLG